MLSFAGVKRELDIGKYYEFNPTIPGGFPEVLMDSGGFQLQTGVRTSMKISVEEYSRWLKSALIKYPEIVGYMNLDILGMPPTREVYRCKECNITREITLNRDCPKCGKKLIKVMVMVREDPISREKRMWDNAEKSLYNLNLLENKGLHPIPIWHDGEPEWFLNYYCQNYDWVAIGGLAGKKMKYKEYYRKLVNRLTQTYPKVKIHLLGIGIAGVEAFTQGNVYSTDFSTWSTVARYGHQIISDKKQIIKEVNLPKEEKDRLRVDKEYQRRMVRDSVQNIKMYEDVLNLVENPDHQVILF